MNKPTAEEVRTAVQDVTKRLVDEGKLIEAGFAAYLIIEWGHDAATKLPNNMLVDLHRCYMSGAQHLWASINDVMDPGTEPSERDLKRMDLIAAELDGFYKEMQARYGVKK